MKHISEIVLGIILIMCYLIGSICIVKAIQIDITDIVDTIGTYLQN